MKKAFTGLMLLLLSVYCFSQQAISIEGELPRPDSVNQYRVQVGSFRIHTNAENLFARLKAAGLNPVYEDYLDFKRVILTALNANDVPALIGKIESLGIKEAWIRMETPNNIPAPALAESTITDPYYYTVVPGEDKAISIEGVPNNSNATWTSRDTSIATVDASGKVVGIRNGSTAITASYSGVSKTIDVSVVPTYSFYEVPKTDESKVSYSDNATSGTEDLNEYTTEPTFRLAYRFTHPTETNGASGRNGGIDILGKGSGNKWMWTSYYQGGLFYDLNGIQHKMSNGIQTDPNGVKLTVEPSFIYDGGVAYLQLTHKLENTSGVTVTGQRFGASSDVMIDENDEAPLTINSYGILMTDIRDSEIANLNLRFICKTGNNISPASTVWIGPWNGGNHLDHIYDNGVSPNYRDGVDSAMAFSYKDITLNAGETKYYTVRFTLARNSR
jgi:hypothetical protein